MTPKSVTSTVPDGAKGPKPAAAPMSVDETKSQKRSEPAGHAYTSDAHSHSSHMIGGQGQGDQPNRAEAVHVPPPKNSAEINPDEGEARKKRDDTALGPDEGMPRKTRK